MNVMNDRNEKLPMAGKMCRFRIVDTAATGLAGLSRAMPRLLMIAALLAGMVGVSTPATAGGDKSVLVTAIVEHPALDAIRDGTRDELKAAGFEAGKNLKWEFQSAQGNAGTAGQIARKYVGENPDVIVAIATPSAQPVVALTKTIPVVYSGVADPIAAQLVKGWAPSGTNVTGLSHMLDQNKQIDIMKQVVPGVKRVGIVYNPGEINSTIIVKQLKSLLEKQGIALIDVPAPRTIDVGPAAKSLIGKVDLIYSTTDNNVVSTYESLVKVCNDAKIPLVASDTDSVKRGAIAAYGVNFYQLGRATGKIVVRILNGEKPGDIPSAVSKDLALFINPSAAKKQGVTLSPAFLKQANQIVQ
jgi:putative ABC transport system substrate-binding protein